MKMSQDKSFQMSETAVLLSSTVLLIIFITSFLETSILELFKDKIFKFLILMTLPGLPFTVLLHQKIKTGFDYFLIINLLFNISLFNFTYVYLTLFFDNITDTTLSSSILGLNIFFTSVYFLCKSKNSTFKSARLNKEHLFSSLGLIFSFLIGYFIILRNIPPSFWRGWDPWLYKPITEIISREGLSPAALIKKWTFTNVNASGFFYLLSAIRISSGIDVYTLLRYGGPIMGGLASTLTYLIIKKIENKVMGLVASLLLFLNPYFINRFSMTIRENYAYVYLLALILLLILKDRDREDGLKKEMLFAIFIALFTSTIFISHSLTPIMAFASYIILFLHNCLNNKHKDNGLIIIILTITGIISLPIYFHSLQFSITHIRNSSLLHPYLAYISLSAIIAIIFFSRRKINNLNVFKKISKILFILFLIGAFYAIMFQQYEQPAYTYLNINMYSKYCMIFSIISLILFRKIINKIILINFFSIIVIINSIYLFNAFSIFRIGLYFTLVLSYLPLKFYSEVNTMLLQQPKKIINTPYIEYIINYMRNYNKSNHLILTLLLLLTSPILYNDVITINSMSSWSNYNQNEVQETENILNYVNETDIIVPGLYSTNILLHVGLDPSRIVSLEDHSNLLNTSDPSTLSQKIRLKYPNVTRVIFFTLTRYSNREIDYPLYKVIKSFGASIKDQHSGFYLFDVQKFS